MNSEVEYWFAKCVGAGWTRINNEMNVTSPGGMVISWNPDTGFRCGVFSNRDFEKLANSVAASMDAGIHENRRKLNECKRRAKELREVLESVETERSTMVDTWVDTDDGGKSLEYSFGPISVSAKVSPDNGWEVSITDGVYEKTGSGDAEDFHDARLKVYDVIITWCDEVAETGRYSIKLMARLRTLIE